jgi:prolyl 4-hydroxylase
VAFNHAIDFMKFHALLPAVFSASWCDQLIKRVSRQGFLPARVNNYGVEQKMTSVRNNDRAAFQDEALALDIEAAFNRVSPLVFLDASPDREFVRIGSDFKIYKYVPGQYFKPHRDGDVTADGVTSLVTVLVYLNDADGGTTVIMPDGYGNKDSWVSITPKTGDVLLFSHDLWHEGRPVATGEKFVLRTDLCYQVLAA